MAPRPQESELPESIILQKFSGLRNTVTPERLAPDELARAVNVDIDDAGQIRRRRGYTRVSSGRWHSLFRSDSGAVYGVKDGSLGIVRPNYTFTSLQSGFTDEPLSYVQVGADIYFSALTNSGRITASNTVVPWGAVVDAGTWLSPVVNPTETLPPIAGRQLGKPPMATSLAYFNGRIYLANDRALWATELYLYNYTDKTKNYKYFEAPITALGAVADGIYVGTEIALWFLSGPFDAMKRVLVLDAGVLPGSMVAVPSELIHPQGQVNPAAPLPAGTVVAFMTTAGLVAGLDSGQIFNLTQTRVLFPEAISMAAFFRRQDGINQYIGVADSGGTPTTAARIGDYVDAVIVRSLGV